MAAFEVFLQKVVIIPNSHLTHNEEKNPMHPSILSFVGFRGREKEGKGKGIMRKNEKCLMYATPVFEILSIMIFFFFDKVSLPRKENARSMTRGRKRQEFQCKRSCMDTWLAGEGPRGFSHTHTYIEERKMMAR